MTIPDQGEAELREKILHTLLEDDYLSINTVVLDEIMAIIAQERVKARAEEMKKSYEAIYHIHMDHSWNEMSDDIKQWLSAQLHGYNRLAVPSPQPENAKRLPTEGRDK